MVKIILFMTIVAAGHQPVKKMQEMSDLDTCLSAVAVILTDAADNGAAYEISAGCLRIPASGTKS